eukprot:NODE_4897_length_440_cov_192.519182_g4237_i0.p1 GENE.NODE_4897_length_440_cov_192.519182_g4237_i0~~NODE_4897_length_440_cov_192.519182_g4237_i0.p1  ORF type:complete len:89 (-),score=7.08 NODE_4897_length_440_cov_192.519182_g4237_i0:4-270(-)
MRAAYGYTYGHPHARTHSYIYTYHLDTHTNIPTPTHTHMHDNPVTTHDTRSNTQISNTSCQLNLHKSSGLLGTEGLLEVNLSPPCTLR